MINLPEVASLDEAADYLRMSPDKLNRLAVAGKIGFLKPGLKRTFPRECVEEFVKANTVAPTASNPHGLTGRAPRTGGKRA